jgi:uncharacterized membrane protein YkvA (DUF1232 family)
MKNFDQLLLENISAYEGRHDDLIFQAPAFYRLMTGLLDDPRLPNRLRPLILAAIAYFILPADIIPEDLEGPYGYIDDIWLCAFVADQVRNELQDDEILSGNWDGETPVIPLVREILARQEEYIGEDRYKVLDYIGYEALKRKNG